jgi:Peptidase inhibitor I78 family
MMRYLCPAALIALSACTPLPPVDDGSADTCGAGSWQNFLGAGVAEAQASGLPAATRIIRPGQAVTMDFQGDRLNVLLNDADRIVRAYCG